MSRLERLHVVAIRYRNDQLVPDDERGLDALAASGAYDVAGVPVEICEPRLDDGERTGVPVEDVGTLCGLIADEVSTSLTSGAAPLMVGGNCVHALGVLGGLEDALESSSRIGLAWLDAHGDFNTSETSPSGSLGGMPVAVAAGLAHPVWRERAHVARLIPFGRILLVGCRDLDDMEEHLVLGSRVAVVGIPGSAPTAADDTRTARAQRAGTALGRAARALAERCDAVYVHVDVDVLDESLVPGHRSRTPGGPGIEDVLSAIDVIMSTGKVAAFAVVSTSDAGDRGDVTVGSGSELVRGGLRSWRTHGMPALAGGML